MMSPLATPRTNQGVLSSRTVPLPRSTAHRLSTLAAWPAVLVYVHAEVELHVIVTDVRHRTIIHTASNGPDPGVRKRMSRIWMAARH